MWYNFYYNTGTGTGETIYQFVPKEVVVGIVEEGLAIKGLAEEEVYALGMVEVPATMYGRTISDNNIEGELESYELKGEESCP